MRPRQILDWARIRLRCGGHFKHLYWEHDRVSVDFHYSPISELDALRGVALHYLGLYGTAVTDWSQLRALDFRALNVGGTTFDEIGVLDGKALIALELYQTSVRSLAGIQSLPLELLQIGGTQIRDFSLVARLPLRTLLMLNCQAEDLSFLAGLDLERFGCTFTPATRGLETLRGMRRLQWVHTTEHDSFSAAEFWHRFDHRLPLDEKLRSYRTGER